MHILGIFYPTESSGTYNNSIRVIPIQEVRIADVFVCIMSSVERHVVHGKFDTMDKFGIYSGGHTCGYSFSLSLVIN
jgi:hypothetical protein